MAPQNAELESCSLVETLSDQLASGHGVGAPLTSRLRAPLDNCTHAWSRCGNYFAWSPGNTCVYIVYKGSLALHQQQQQQHPRLDHGSHLDKHFKHVVYRTAGPTDNTLSLAPTVKAVRIDTKLRVHSLVFSVPTPIVEGDKGRKWLPQVAEGLLLATGQSNGRIKLWKIVDGESTLIMELLDHTDLITSLRVSQDESILSSTSKDGSAKLWDLTDDGNMFQTIKFGGSKRSLFDTCWGGGDKNTLAVVGNHRKIFLYSQSRFTSKRRYEKQHELTGHSNDITACDFSPNGHLLVSSSLDTLAILWEVASGTKLYEFGHVFPKPDPLLSGGSNSITVSHTSFSPDGRHFCTVSDDNLVRVWDILDPALPARCIKSSNARQARYAPHSRQLTVVKTDKSVEFYETPRSVSSLQHICRMSIRHQIASTLPRANPDNLARAGAVNARAINNAISSIILPSKIKEFLRFVE